MRPSATLSLTSVKTILQGMRPPLVIEETDLQDLVGRRLEAAGVPFEREVRLGPHERIDFMVVGSVGIECKKGAPNRTQLLRQVARYCSHDEVDSLIVLTPRRYHLGPVHTVNGKPVLYMSTNELWGLSI
jgi:hypothetical protein